MVRRLSSIVASRRYPFAGWSPFQAGGHGSSDRVLTDGGFAIENNRRAAGIDLPDGRVRRYALVTRFSISSPEFEGVENS